MWRYLTKFSLLQREGYDVCGAILVQVVTIKLPYGFVTYN